MLAGAMTGDAIWVPAPFLVPAIVAAIAIYAYQRAGARKQAEPQRFGMRKKTLPGRSRKRSKSPLPLHLGTNASFPQKISLPRGTS